MPLVLLFMSTSRCSLLITHPLWLLIHPSLLFQGFLFAQVHVQFTRHSTKLFMTTLRLPLPTPRCDVACPFCLDDTHNRHFYSSFSLFCKNVHSRNCQTTHQGHQ